MTQLSLLHWQSHGSAVVVTLREPQRRCCGYTDRAAAGGFDDISVGSVMEKPS